LIFKNDKIENLNADLQDIQQKYNNLQKEILIRDKQIKKNRNDSQKVTKIINNY